MTEASREHTSDEFGRSPLTDPDGVNLRTLGSRQAVILEGIVERESGKTPAPPVVSMTTVVIVLAVLFLLGVAIVVGWVLVTGHMPVPSAI